LSVGFLLPALVLLGLLVVYPICYTLWRSLYDASGSGFVGLDNYVTMFTDSATFTAIKNNVIWVVVAPALITALGLIFAVVTERVRWAVAFKLVVFMPMAISMVAAGVIFTLVYDHDPNQGVLNAVVVGVHDSFSEPSAYPGAHPRDGGPLKTAPGGAFETGAQVQPGQSVLLPLVAVPPEKQSKLGRAGTAAARPGTITEGHTEPDRRHREGAAQAAGRSGLGRQGGRPGDVRGRRHVRVQEPVRRVVHGAAGGLQLRTPLRWRDVAGTVAGHPRDHRRLHLDVGGVRDGADRCGPGGDPA
jgi:hypothetical protein